MSCQLVLLYYICPGMQTHTLCYHCQRIVTSSGSVEVTLLAVTGMVVWLFSVPRSDLLEGSPF